MKDKSSGILQDVASVQQKMNLNLKKPVKESKQNTVKLCYNELGYNEQNLVNMNKILL